MIELEEFLLVLQQDGNGCDYTIGCGIKYEEITLPCNDSSLREKKLKERLSDFGYSENMVTTAFLIPMDQVEHLPVQQWILERETEEKKRSEQYIKEEELRQLEFLKRKYEK